MRGYLENSVKILQQKIDAADIIIAQKAAEWGYAVIDTITPVTEVKDNIETIVLKAGKGVGNTLRSVDVHEALDRSGRGYSESLRECYGTERWMVLVDEIEKTVGLIETELPQEVWNNKE